MDEEQATSPPQTRRPYVPGRSAVSHNWRTKDDSPRAEQPQQQQQRRPEGGRFQRRDNYDDPASGGSPRNNGYQRQAREPVEIPSEVTTPRLYVGNLLYSAQAADVENFFVANGFKPTNLSMSIDPMTGRNPSYCFVDLESVEEAKQAMEELNGKEILGRSVRINPGVARKDGGGTPGRDPLRTKSYEGGNRGQWRESGPGGDKESKPAFDRWNRNDASQQWNRPQEQGRRLYVGGLPRMEPQSEVDAAMQKLFSGFEISTVSKIISPHPSKASEPGDHYYLFVDLANIEDVDAAIEALNDSTSPFSESGEGKLKINRARDNTGRKVIREQGDRPSQGDRSFGRPTWRDQ